MNYLFHDKNVLILSYFNLSTCTLQEIAGLGGDTNYFKQEGEFQINKTLMWDSVCIIYRHFLKLLNDIIENRKFNKHTLQVFLSNGALCELCQNITTFQVLQLSLAAGIMNPIFSGTKLRINDRFFLGGPLTLRGFNLKGVGPHEDGKCLFL